MGMMGWIKYGAFAGHEDWTIRYRETAKNPEILEFEATNVAGDKCLSEFQLNEGAALHKRVHAWVEELEEEG